MTPQFYTQVYDAIVSSILKVQPNMKFVGLALAFSDPSWVQYFLNASNHLPNIPLDWISYHFYAQPNVRTNTTQYPMFFSSADSFFQKVIAIEKFRTKLSPSTRTTIDELGVILPDDNVENPVPIPDIYWNAAGAMFAYVVGNLIPLGIDVLGESQLIGYPTQFPSVSLVRYPDGQPNARFWVLYLLHKHLGVGDEIVNAQSDSSDVFVSAYITAKGKRILCINKTNYVQQLSIPNLTNGQIEFVDYTTNFNPPQIQQITANTQINLTPFGVAVIIQ